MPLPLTCCVTLTKSLATVVFCDWGKKKNDSYVTFHCISHFSLEELFLIWLKSGSPKITQLIKGSVGTQIWGFLES